MSDRIVYIYHLIESDTGLVRYVGKTVDPAHRLQSHRNGYTSNLHMRRWAAKMRREGRAIDMRIIRECPEWDWERAEIEEIEKQRNAGAKLLNAAAGGAGVTERLGKLIRRHRPEWGCLSRARVAKAKQARMIPATIQQPKQMSVRSAIADHIRYAVYEKYVKYTGDKTMSDLDDTFIITHLDELADHIFEGVITGPMIRESYERTVASGNVGSATAANCGSDDSAVRAQDDTAANSGEVEDRPACRCRASRKGKESIPETAANTNERAASGTAVG